MAKVELGGNADAVEFCPNEPYLHILAAASYTLQEGHDGEEGGGGGGGTRLGELYLFSAGQEEEEEEEEGHHPSSSTLNLTKLYHQETTAGVFDIKWRPYDDGGPPCLAQASADGSLSLHKLEEGPEPSSTTSLELHEKASLDLASNSSMCLYVDWNPVHSNSEVVVSHSDGSISLVDLGQSEPEISDSWQAHDFEAWVVAYDAWKPHVVYSGGDDCQFCCWDLRDKTSHHLVFRDKKTHSMGVCSIQSNALWEHMLVTGSYDESIRVFDVRMTQKPLLKAELGVGGGVWRLKWHHTSRDILLAACMHNGAAIVRVGEGEFQVLDRYKEHKSLAYGASWYRGHFEGKSQGCSSVVTTSGAKETEQILQCRAAMEEVRGADPKLTADKLTEREIGSEARISVNSSQVGLESFMLTKPLVATCSFYDRAVHLWRPQTFRPKVT